MARRECSDRRNDTKTHNSVIIDTAIARLVSHDQDAKTVKNRKPI